MKKIFSDRIGITNLDLKIQYDYITKELRNSLWNAFDLYYLAESKSHRDNYALKDSYLYKLAINLSMYYFKVPVDNLPYFEDKFLSGIREYFLTTEWFNVYNFLEFCYEYIEASGVDKVKYTEFTNALLKAELSGYRIVGDNFAPIIHEEEIKSINDSLKLSQEQELVGVHSHISAALEILSNRTLNNSDKYRNSIKESISAVEALCNKLNTKKSDGLSGALNLLKKKIDIHGALEAGFIKLYGYTSDSNGIRHTIMDEPNLDSEDAIYMLVTCSAFVNYLIQKASKGGLL